MRVASELCNVVDHPVQRQYLVHQSVVARGVMRRLVCQLRMREKAEDAQAVVDGDGDHAVADQRAVIVERASTRSADVGSAMNPEHDRKQMLRRPLRSDHVEVKAIFTAQKSIEFVPVAEYRLSAGGAVPYRVANVMPRLGRHRLAPAQVANRRFGCFTFPAFRYCWNWL